MKNKATENDEHLKEMYVSRNMQVILIQRKQETRKLETCSKEQRVTHEVGPLQMNNTKKLIVALLIIKAPAVTGRVP